MIAILAYLRTILNDVAALTYGYPIYTKPGAGGGIFIMEGYKPYNNTLTPYEQEKLKKMYDAAEGADKEILKRVLKKYGEGLLWSVSVSAVRVWRTLSAKSMRKQSKKI